MNILIHGECKSLLKKLAQDGIQVDSIVTDPPYELGFMGKSWDSTGIAYDKELWSLALQVLKPGGHLLSFSSSRTYHRMACAIEDAGFEIRDQIMWLYGQGFPKSHDISKAIDKKAGVERTEFYKSPIAKPDSDCWSAPNKNSKGDNGFAFGDKDKINNYHDGEGNVIKSLPATDLAKQWQGWGTALKPAHEPIVMARKPLSEKTVSENVIEHGVGGINIDECRISYNFEKPSMWFNKENRQGVKQDIYGNGKGLGNNFDSDPSLGRFPANIIHDGSKELEMEFAKYGKTISPSKISLRKANHSDCMMGGYPEREAFTGYGDKGSASRFFYCAKASKKDRNGSKHPTVKPIALMRYLCRLVTPPNGTLLDPFAGTGTTGQAAKEEGFNYILIEKESEYIADICNRLYSDKASRKQEELGL